MARALEILGGQESAETKVHLLKKVILDFQEDILTIGNTNPCVDVYYEKRKKGKPWMHQQTEKN